MTVISTVMTLATRGEVVKAETVAGDSVEVVEFFSPDAFAPYDQDKAAWDAITIDVPVEVWEQMGQPTEITFSIKPGNIIEHYGDQG